MFQTWEENMLLKTKTIITIGVLLTIMHIILMFFNYSQILNNLFGLIYIGFFSIFFILWGCVHLSVVRLMSNNQQTYNMSRNNVLMSRYVKLKQYYSSKLSKDELKLNLSSNAMKYDTVYLEKGDGEIMISENNESQGRQTQVAIKFFSDDDKLTLATEVVVGKSEVVSKFKIFIAGLLFLTSFIGLYALVFVFLIHIVSMIEILSIQSKTRTHLNKVDELISHSVEMNEYY